LIVKSITFGYAIIAGVSANQYHNRIQVQRPVLSLSKPCTELAEVCSAFGVITSIIIKKRNPLKSSQHLGYETIPL
jgi:hypothetical protein